MINLANLIWGCVAALFSVFIGLYFYMTRNFDHWRKRGVVESKPIPFFGNFYQCVALKKTVNQFLEDMYNDFEGQRYVGFHLFDKPALIARNPEDTIKMFVTDFNVFSNKYSASDDHDPLGSASLLLVKAQHWKTLRSKLTPVFFGKKLKNMFPLIVQVGDNLDSHFEAHGVEGDGRVIELRDTCSRYMTDVIGTCAYGIRMNCLNNPEAEFRKCGERIFNFTYKRALEFGAFFFAPGIVKPLGLMFFEKHAGNFLRKIFWDTLTKRMEDGTSRNDLIDALIELKRGQTQAEIDDPDVFTFDGDNLTAQAAFYFIAGSETTATTLSFALFELALHEDIQTRLREEIIEALTENDGKIEYDWVTKLPYMDMVFCETLRKYPTIGYQERIVARDYKLPNSDVVIAKGTPVFAPIAGYHHDPKYFPDPDKFDPERFNSENKQARPIRGYMPFGEGPRNCVGLRFGQSTFKMGLVKIIGKYKLSPSKETVIPLRLSSKSTLLTMMDHGLFLHVQKITSESEDN